MASSPLPSPGHLILENITLLAGSPTAFHTRYGFTITPSTFAKHGSSGPANAVLHFLISIIDADVAEPLFKPCFPILDRDQERDFRKVVDTRLAILERTKLLPAGSARKSIVASAGGDKFVDLLWGLSSLAVQQACLRHPAYASVSRIRLLSHQSRSDTASQHPASRSSRSLRSTLSSRSERHTTEPTRHRRFLGTGMLSASQQRSKDAEEMRARIDSERTALTRTTDMGQHGAKTWASEADSLREKIDDFEAKLRRLKGQLADMGFDEHGVDIRAKGDLAEATSTAAEIKSDPHAHSTGGRIVPSHSGDDLRDELKTSPIESTESCSSVDDPGEPCEDLAADLSCLLTFTAESRQARKDIVDSVEAEKPDMPFANANKNQEDSLITSDADTSDNPHDIVQLVRVAADELEEATNRMQEIRAARENAGIRETATNSEDDVVERQPHAPPESSSPNKKKSATHEIQQVSESVEAVPPTEHVEQNESPCHIETGQPTIPSPNVENADLRIDSRVQLEQKATRILEEHNVVIESSRGLQKEAAQLSEKAAPPEKTETAPANSSSSDHFVDAISKPHWYTSAAANSARKKKTENTSVAGKKQSKVQRGAVNTLADMAVVAKVIRPHAPPHVSRSFNSRRRKEGTKSLDFIELPSESFDKMYPSSPQNDSDALYTPSESNGSLKGTPRSVRFAALPPSYSASRSSDDLRQMSSVRPVGASRQEFLANIDDVPDAPKRPKDQEECLVANGPMESCGVSATEASANHSHVEDQRPEDLSRKSSKSSRKTGGTRKAEKPSETSENRRRGSVSSQKPPRGQRTRTTQRIVRPKEAMQRSVASNQHHSPSRNHPIRPFSKRSSSLDSIGALRRSRRDTSPSLELDQDSIDEMQSTNVEEKCIAAETSLDTVQQVESENAGASDICGPLSPPISIEGTQEEVDGLNHEHVQKKLFMTPESAVSSSNATRPLSRLGERARQSSRLSAMGMPQSSNRGIAASREVKDASDVNAMAKDFSVEFPSTDEEELLFSPAAKPPLPRKSSQMSTSSTGGFFAGQTAEWQQSVRAQSATRNQASAASSRGSCETAGRGNKAAGKSSSSGMRSRVHSLRARLAALK